jgi:uncharacterized protein (DUF58 family)
MSRSATLTQRGWALLAVTAVLVVGAVIFGVEELYAVAGAALVLVVAARIWVTVCRWDVEVVRHIRPTRVPAGASARVELSVTNQGIKRSPLLTARDPFDGGRRWARFLIAPLGPGEVRKAAYSLPTVRRGVFELGPLELEVCDPFGLARRIEIGQHRSSLTVHPKVEPLRIRHLPSSPDPDTRVPMPVVGRIGDEFYALREYVTGDDLRRVHWAATARTDTLMIRQPENLLQGRLTVVVDLRSAVHDPVTLEAVLSAAASIVVSGLRNRVHVRLMSTAGTYTVYGTTALHGAALLDILAGAATHPGTTLVDDLRGKASLGPLALLTTTATTAADMGAVTRTGEGSETTVVVFERVTRSADARQFNHTGVHGRAVVVPAGGSFRAAWEGASKC